LEGLERFCISGVKNGNAIELTGLLNLSGMKDVYVFETNNYRILNSIEKDNILSGKLFCLTSRV